MSRTNVATGPDELVLDLQRLAPGIRCLAQQVVPGVVDLLVVDPLESVDVEQGRIERPAVALCMGQMPGELGVRGPAVALALL